MLTSIQLSDMDLTTHSKSSFSSQKTKTPTKLLSSNHMKASVQKKKKKAYRQAKRTVHFERA